LEGPVNRKIIINKHQNMQKTLIVFGTRRGTTTETVQTIARVLNTQFNHEVTLCSSSEIRPVLKRVGEFDNIIIGSSIVSGRWKRKVLKFARKDMFAGKQVAVFVTAGGTMNKVERLGITKEEAIREAIVKYIDKYQPKFKFIPVSKMAFGGKVVKKRFTKYNNWVQTDIETWAIELGNRLNN